MTQDIEFTPNDILVFNDDPDIKRNLEGFSNNIGPYLDEYRPISKYAFSPEYYRSADAGLMYVENVKTGNHSSGFWWRFKKKEYPIFRYDPTQSGDTDEDI